ncbi:MAG TPA: M23 family metallopeptidase [Candidatus Hydrogenedens sp.]|nr:M23 family metallopeptidase [Candidatus Hydrogenedens sp.]
MKFLPLFIPFIFVCIPFLSAGESFILPLKGDLFATSSFGEYRDGRFHMGVDYRATIGTPVYAIDDGYVARMRCSPWGYGRVLYIQFHSGIMGIYAHLHSFAEPYQSYLRKVQHQKESFTVDLTLKENELPVKKGALIAYTGQSGTKAPHLHFELRTKDGITCLNPWEYGFRWIDRNKPQITSLLVIPGSMDTTINGRCLPLEIPITEKTALPILINAKGAIGFGVSTIDNESDTCKLGPYRISLKTTDTVLSTIQQDRLDYNTYRDAIVSFYPYISNPIYWLLWQWQGNQSPNYKQVRKEWLSIEDDEHIQIEVEDFKGNKTQVPLYITGNPANRLNKKIEKSDISISYLPEFLVLEILLASTSSKEAPEITCTSEQGTVSLKPVQRTSNIYELPWKPTASGKYTFRVSHPSMPVWEKSVYAVKTQSKMAPIVLNDFQIDVPSHISYGILWLSISPVSSQKVPKGLTIASNIWKIEPYNMPIAEAVTIKMRIRNNVQAQERIHLYRKSGSSWSRIDSQKERDFVIGKVSDWGTFALIRDDEPPQITNIAINKDAKQPTKRPSISAVISDIGSGIARAEIFCDQKWLLSEYDGPRGILRWEQDEDLPSGTHTITFIVADYAGLTQKEMQTISVP